MKRNAIFFSNMSDDLWKERFALEMKDGTKSVKCDSQKQRYFVQLRKKNSEVSEALKFEYGVAKKTHNEYTYVYDV